jgi:hypothetical protein
MGAMVRHQLLISVKWLAYDCSVDVQGASLSAASSADVQGVSLSTAGQGVSNNLHHRQCIREGSLPLSVIRGVGDTENR